MYHSVTRSFRLPKSLHTAFDLKLQTGLQTQFALDSHTEARFALAASPKFIVIMPHIPAVLRFMLTAIHTLAVRILIRL